jgi:hypothetical protein
MYLGAKRVPVPIGLLVTLLSFGAAASAQSGRAVMNGYVAFENVAYVDKQPRARVELCAGPNRQHCGAGTETGEHGSYAINPAPLGEWWLHISAPGFTPYETRIYLPSDFIGNLAVLLKQTDDKKKRSSNEVGRGNLSSSETRHQRKRSLPETAHNGTSNHIVASGGNVIKAEYSRP